MANAKEIRTGLEREIAKLSEASESVESKLKSAADDFTTISLALDKVLKKEFAPNVSARLRTIEKELAKLKKAYERELANPSSVKQRATVKTSKSTKTKAVKIYRQSAVLPYRLEGDEISVLLVTSAKGARWVVPKGRIERGMSAPGSAAKEALEEAGIMGEVSDQGLDSYTYKKWGGTCWVEVFPMEVTTEMSQWPEMAVRRREWLPLNEAAKRLSEKDLKKIVRSLPKAIASRTKAQRRSHESGPAAEKPLRSHGG